MHRLSVALLAAALALGCSPTFNWRAVPVEGTGLRAMLPCKPDQGTRSVPLAGRETLLNGLACDAGGATFAVFVADVGQAGAAAAALGHWQRAAQANLQAGDGQAQPFVPAGALALPQSQRIRLQGRRPDGSAVQSEAAYFARGGQVFQAVIYAEAIQPEWAQAFFEGLAFQ